MKALFTFDDITNIEEKNWIAIENTAELCCTNLEEIIEQIGENKVIVFNTKGKFSLYNLVEHLIENLPGESTIRFTTYGLSEPGVRKLANLKYKGKLAEIYCLLDYRIAQRQPKAFKLISAIATKIAYQESHAKITVIENPYLSITIIGSQNWTRNTKHEAGAVICSKLITDFYKNYINAHLDNGRAVGTD
jgi:hypothetical protein